MYAATSMYAAMHSCGPADVDTSAPGCIELSQAVHLKCYQTGDNGAQEVESTEAVLHSKEAACQAAQDKVTSNRLQLQASRYQLQHLSACFACFACYACRPC